MPRRRRNLFVGAVFYRNAGTVCPRIRGRSYNGIDERLAVQRLRQESLRPGRRASFADTRIIESRDHNCRDLRVDAVQVPLQIESAEVRHVNVNNEAFRYVTAHGVDELPRRTVGRRLERRCFQQTSQRRAYGRLVVNYSNPYGSLWRHLPDFRANAEHSRVARRAYFARPLAGHLGWGDSGFISEANQIGHAPYTELRHHSPAVDLHRFFDSADAGSDLLIKTAGNDVREYFPFPVRESGKAVANRFGFIAPLARQRVDLRRSHNRGKKRFAFDGFRQEIDRTRLHCPDTCRHVALAGQENYRALRPRLDQRLLQMQPIELGHHKIDDCTAGDRRIMR